jgi:hypothetical protein
VQPPETGNLRFSLPRASPRKQVRRRLAAGGTWIRTSVPRRRIYANTGIAADRDTGGADWREIGRLGKDSRWMQSRPNVCPPTDRSDSPPQATTSRTETEALSGFLTLDHTSFRDALKMFGADLDRDRRAGLSSSDDWKSRENGNNQTSTHLRNSSIGGRRLSRRCDMAERPGAAT